MVQTSKSGLHLLFTADILKQLVANLVPPYQAARSKNSKGDHRMERHPKTRSLPKFRGRIHQTHPSTLFSPIFSLAREKMGPPEARQKRPRRNESLQARLLILCARFFLSKPQTEFAVWVFSMQICDNLSVSAAPSQRPCKGILI